MTAMPPTKGHLRLIQFASLLAEETVVIVCTQPGEPMIDERVHAIRQEVADNSSKIRVEHLHKTLPQEPQFAVNFWDLWADILKSFGLTTDDIIVASELYGKNLAEVTGAKFMPYDPDRSILWAKATEVRNSPRHYFDTVMPEFQENLRMTVTLFGAESTGKTTLSKALATHVNGHWIPEWARPYLETVGIEITTQSMTDIWKGQKALQDHAYLHFYDKPFIIQDTDLYSTVGYWDMWNMKTPWPLVRDAQSRASEVYLITQSHIPFEKDPIRYGGDKRESSDQYWIDLCEMHGLSYYVVQSNDPKARVLECAAVIEQRYDELFKFSYQRLGAEYVQ